MEAGGHGLFENTILEFMWRLWKPKENLKMASNSAEIQTAYLLNISVENYYYNILFGGSERRPRDPGSTHLTKLPFFIMIK